MPKSRKKADAQSFDVRAIEQADNLLSIYGEEALKTAEALLLSAMHGDSEDRIERQRQVCTIVRQRMAERKDPDS